MINRKKYLKMFLILGAICAVSGILITLVSESTSPRIEEAKLSEEQKIIEEMFGEGITYEKEEIDNEVIDAKYSVFQESELLGYAYLASAPNEYGKITIIESISVDGKILGIEYLEFSQTPGFGDKIDNNEFRGQFLEQKYSDYKLDAVSGATISSRLVEMLMFEVALEHAKYLGSEDEIIADAADVNEKLIAMFGDEAQFEEKKLDDEFVSKQFVVSRADKQVGYAYLANTTNEYGEIEILKGISMDGKIVGVAYVDFIQTAGFGDKIDNDDFRNQFVNKKYDEYKADVVSGATMSTDSVNMLISKIGIYHTDYLSTVYNHRFMGGVSHV